MASASRHPFRPARIRAPFLAALLLACTLPCATRAGDEVEPPVAVPVAEPVAAAAAAPVAGPVPAAEAGLPVSLADVSLEPFVPTDAEDADEGPLVEASGIDGAEEEDPLADGVRAVIELALQHVGTPYRFGGASPVRGFDCSGLVTYVFQKTVGLALPHRSRDLARIGTPVKSIADLLPGDLVFFNTRGARYSHVGIYLGGSKFVHAPYRGKSVRVSDIRSRYFTRRFNGGRRIGL